VASYTLYDAESGSAVSVTQEQLQPALKSGRYGFLKGRKYRLTDYQGNPLDVDGEHAAKAILEHGFTPEAAEDRPQRVFEDAGLGGATGKAAALVTGADKVLSAGVATGIAAKIMDQAYGEGAGRLFDFAEQANPKTALAGLGVGLAGAVASPGILGAVPSATMKIGSAGAAKLGLAKVAGETGAKATLRALGQGAVATGTAAGIEGAGMYFREEALGNIEHSAENMATFVGLSTLLGGGLGALTKGGGLVYSGLKGRVLQGAQAFDAGADDAMTKVMGEESVPGLGKLMHQEVADVLPGKGIGDRLMWGYSKTAAKMKGLGTSAEDIYQFANKTTGKANVQKAMAAEKNARENIPKLATSLQDMMDRTKGEVAVKLGAENKADYYRQFFNVPAGAAPTNEKAARELISEVSERLSRYRTTAPEFTSGTIRGKFKEAQDALELHVAELDDFINGYQLNSVDDVLKFRDEAQVMIFDKMDDIKKALHTQAGALQSVEYAGQANQKLAANKLREMSDAISDFLGDGKRWGDDLVRIYKENNKASSVYLDATNVLRRELLHNNAKIIDPDKLSTHLKTNATKGRQAIRKGIIGNFLDASDDYLRVMEKNKTLAADTAMDLRKGLRDFDAMYAGTSEGLLRANQFTKMGATGLGLQAFGSRAGSLTANLMAGAAGTGIGASAGFDPLGATTLGTVGFALAAMATNPAQAISVFHKIQHAGGGLQGNIAKMLGASKAPFQSVFGALHKNQHVLIPQVLSKTNYRGEPNKEKQVWEHLKDRIEELTELSNNPELLGSQVRASLGEISHFAPKISEQMAFMAVQDVQYLLSKAPRDPLPPDPFAEKPREWRPSYSEMSNFASTMAMLEDFRVFLSAAREGTLTDNLVQTGWDRRGETMHKVVAAISGAIEDGQKVSPELRRSLRQILKMPATMPGALASFQSIYQPNAGQGQNAPQVASSRGSGAKTKLNPGNWAPQSQTGVLGPRS